MNDTKKYFIGLDSIIEQAKKSRHNCMCPNCQSIAIGSHVFSRSHILEPISRQSKICQFEQRPLVHMDDGIVRYWPKGIKGAFKFNGFCQKHDNEIFAPIEPNDDSLIDWSELKSQYLLCYRTICREIYANQIMHDIFEHLILHSGANIPYYKEQLMFKLTRTNANKSSLMYYKTFLENGIFHSDFSNLHFYFAELPFQLDLCIASPVSIQSDKGPDFNRDYQELYIINIFPYKGKTVIIIGYSNCFENSWLKNIIPKFESSYPHRVSSAFVDVLYRAEFHAISPALFDSLDKELLDAFYQTWIKESDNFSEEIEEVSNLFYAKLNKIMPSTWKTLYGKGNMKTNIEDKELDIAYFLSFCMEQYKNRHQMSGKEVATLFEQYGVLPYLEDNFEVLHTQGHRWLMDEIDEWINNRKNETKI